MRQVMRYAVSASFLCNGQFVLRNGLFFLISICIVSA